MKIKKSLLTILLVLALSMPSLSQARFKPSELDQPHSTQNENAQTLSKKEWISNLERDLPALLCEKDQYFIKCFDVTINECAEFTKLLVQACLNNATLAIPQDLNNHQGEYWGQMVGHCSYDLYEKFMQPKKKALSECKHDKKEDLPKPSQSIP